MPSTPGGSGVAPVFSAAVLIEAYKEREEIISKLKNVKEISAGSALKFCLVAEGKVDIYVRNGPTMEGDTAAGHCVAQEAGASVKRIDGSGFLYNKKALVNPGFILTAVQF